MDVPLRSNQAKGGDGALVYRQLEGSGRIALVLYVAQEWWWGRGSELRGPTAAAQESQTGFNSFDISGGKRTDGGGNR